MSTSDFVNFVWPLCFLLVALIVLRKVEAEVKPIVTSVVTGVAQGAQKNAMIYAMAGCYGISASLMAFSEVFGTLGHDEWAVMTWHEYAGLWAKVLNPFLIAALAYMRQPGTKDTGGTNPPIPTR